MNIREGVIEERYGYMYKLFSANERIEFYEHVREVIHTNHFSNSTEKTYMGWIYRFIIFKNQRHPKAIDFDSMRLLFEVVPFFTGRWYRFTPALKIIISFNHCHTITGLQYRCSVMVYMI